MCSLPCTATPSELAEQVDTSIQNVQYHLEKLESAELIEVADTWYSEKGREMSVYAPTNGPLVVFPGSADDAFDLEQVLKGAVGAVAILGIVGALIEAVARELIPGLAGEDGALDQPAIAETGAAETHWLVGLVTGVSPGLLFFLGGLTILGIVAGTMAIPRN